MNDQQRRTDTFLRGLATGAVVGAVIAGSTLLERRRRKAAVSAGESPTGADQAGADGAVAGRAPTLDSDAGPDAPGVDGAERLAQP